MNNSSDAFRVDRLIKRRKEMGLKSKELSKLCSMSDMQISRIESGERGVTIDTLVKLSQTLGCSTDWLLGLSNDEIRVIPQG